MKALDEIFDVENLGNRLDRSDRKKSRLVIGSSISWKRLVQQKNEKKKKKRKRRDSSRPTLVTPNVVWEWISKSEARAKMDESHSRSSASDSTGGPRTESWVQCLLDEPFPSPPSPPRPPLVFLSPSFFFQTRMCHRHRRKVHLSYLTPPASFSPSSPSPPPRSTNLTYCLTSIKSCPFVRIVK